MSVFLNCLESLNFKKPPEIIYQLKANNGRQKVFDSNLRSTTVLLKIFTCCPYCFQASLQSQSQQIPSRQAQFFLTKEIAHPEGITDTAYMYCQGPEADLRVDLVG